MHPLRLGPRLAPGVFAEIRRTMELAHCKWDAQVGDVTTLADFPLVVSGATWTELAALAEALTAETLAMEEELLERPALLARLAVPAPLRRAFASGVAPTPAALRVMRFDFHFTTDGWRVSEVNSDVPGGLTEATSFTQLVAAHGRGYVPAGDPTFALVSALARSGGPVALVSAAGHMEDHQVVAYVANALRERGVEACVMQPSQLRWRGGVSDYAAIYRFFQAEWLAHARGFEWQPFFVGGGTPVANPGIAALSESKRLPLLWDDLRTPLPTWRRVLPETRALADAPWSSDDGWLLKSAFSNTGDTVSIRSELCASAWRARAWAARLRPGRWVAQRRFTTVPLDGETPCIGVFTVNGHAAGAYARLAKGAVVDGHARDVALLVEASS